MIVFTVYCALYIGDYVELSITRLFIVWKYTGGLVMHETIHLSHTEFAHV